MPMSWEGSHCETFNLGLKVEGKKIKLNRGEPMGGISVFGDKFIDCSNAPTPTYKAWATYRKSSKPLCSRIDMT